MTTPKDIKTAIKTIIADAVGGSTSKVTTWLDAEPPPSQYPSSCFGWVEWTGGPQKSNTMQNRTIIDNFYISIVVKNLNAKGAEDDLMDLAQAVETLLEANPKISATVLNSEVTNRVKEKQFQGDVSIAAVQITLSTIRWT